MAVTMNQEYISTKVPDSGRDYTRRKSKQDLQSHQFPEANIYHCKGLAKFQCQNITQNFRSYILRSQRVLKDIDFNFMQLITNDFEEPEYNSYNTNIAREAGQKLQPITYVTYFPLINMNPAEPDTILKTATENPGQT